MQRARSFRVALLLALSLGVASLWLGAMEPVADPPEPGPPAATALGSVHLGVDAAAFRARPDGVVERMLVTRTTKQKSSLAAGVATSTALVALLAAGRARRRAAIFAVQPAFARRAPARAPPLFPLLLA